MTSWEVWFSAATATIVTIGTIAIIFMNRHLRHIEKTRKRSGKEFRIRVLDE